MIQQFRNSRLTWYGMRGRADVEVLRPAPEQQVADAAADEVGDVVVLMEPVEHLQRVGVDLAARDRVLGARHDDRTVIEPHCNSGIRSSSMRARGLRVLLALLVCSRAAGGVGAPSIPALAKARALYNAGDYDGAISAAAVARRDPAARRRRRAGHRARRISSATGSAPTPPIWRAAREALGVVRVRALTPRDQVDLLVGLGQSLYLGETSAPPRSCSTPRSSRASLLPERDRLLLLDWWATALDREAQTRPADRRARVLRAHRRADGGELRQRSGERGRELLARGRRPRQPATSIAPGMPRSPPGCARRSTPERRALRADLDRLVTQALIPERARTRPAREQPDSMAALRAEWDLVKQQWK